LGAKGATDGLIESICNVTNVSLPCIWYQWSVMKLSEITAY